MVNKRHAEIAGAGLGGLAVGAALAQSGWSVRIHERAGELRMFGAGIWLWENGLKSLNLLGAEKAATAQAKRITHLVLRDENGQELMRRPFGEQDRLLIPPRADLYDSLISAAEDAGAEIVTNSRARAATSDGHLVLDDGTRFKADLVVAADGAYSRIRESLYLTDRITYLDEGYIRILIPRRPSDPPTEVTENWSGSRRLLYDPCTDEVDYICLCCHVDDERGRAVPIDRVTWLESFPHLEDMIERFPERGRWDRGMTVQCRSWSAGRVVIVGDAAHAQPPNLGQGANLTFTNAVSLAAALDGATDVPAALKVWEQRERPLTDHVQRWTNLYGRAASSWPKSLSRYRTRVLERVSRIGWVDSQLNRAARYVPVGAA